MLVAVNLLTRGTDDGRGLHAGDGRTRRNATRAELDLGGDAVDAILVDRLGDAGSFFAQCTWLCALVLDADDQVFLIAGIAPMPLQGELVPRLHRPHTATPNEAIGQAQLFLHTQIDQSLA